MTENILIHQKIKEYREEKGITQRELADMLCVSPQTISKWERDECYPDISFLPVLARILECGVNEFFE